MLKLKNIIKTYNTSGITVNALKGINLCFRKNEFVSILGSSGCGKTTILNIIGGLDKFTSGDLIIDGKSTKSFTDRDWNNYRNNRVGFVFQSYNLIAHQTIEENVRLSLAISGVSKEEAIRRAREALDRVGLKGLYSKKPSQLSGGQCQRVAIARSLINNPDIILADEPTGALDNKSSREILDILKEIALHRLVIMVTHNTELAEDYSTRIISLSDGEVINDTNEYNFEIASSKILNDNKKAKMSFLTAFRLSFKNLLSKKRRTILSTIACSIGIIGISVVLAMSRGINIFINNQEEALLRTNPVKIAAKDFDYEALLDLLTIEEKKSFINKDGYINIDSMISYVANKYSSLVDTRVSNNITQDYINYIKSMPSSYSTEILYDYSIDLSNNLYTLYKDKLNSSSVSEYRSLSFIENFNIALLKEYDLKESAILISNFTNPLNVLTTNYDFLLSQYDVVAGNLPKEDNEMLLVINEDKALNDYLLALYGFYGQEDFLNIPNSIKNNSKYNKEYISFDEILNKEYFYYKNDEILKRRENSNCYFDYSYNASNLNSGYKMKIAGIVKVKDGLDTGFLKNGLYYTNSFLKKYINDNINSEINTYLRGSGGSIKTYIADGKPLKGIYYKYNYTLDGNTIKEGYSSIGKTNAIVTLISGYLENSSSEIDIDYYTISLRALGGEALPSSISIYSNSINNNEKIINYLDEWNSENDIIVNDKLLNSSSRSDMRYNNTISLVVSIIEELIDLITLSILGFTSLALIVSCVMISILTYASVLERVKEIGVIRALGGRKMDVSNLFNAENLIIGFISGIFGILITYILQLIINIIIATQYQISNIMIFTPITSVTMVVVSMLLNVLSGLIPALRSSKLNPVDALRAE